MEVCAHDTHARTHAHTHTHTHTHTGVAGEDTAATASKALAISVASPASRRRAVPQGQVPTPEHGSRATAAAQSRPLSQHSSTCAGQPGQEPPADALKNEDTDTDKRGAVDAEDLDEACVESATPAVQADGNEGQGGLQAKEERDEGGDLASLEESGEGSGVGMDKEGLQGVAADANGGSTVNVPETEKVCVCVHVCARMCVCA